MICGVRLTQRSSQKIRTRPLTDREGRGVCRPKGWGQKLRPRRWTAREGRGVGRPSKSAGVVRVAFGTLWFWGGPPGGGGGDVGFGSGQATGGNPFKLGSRAHRSRQRTAI